jgi:hypothetical protein
MENLPDEQSLFQTFTTKDKKSSVENKVNRRLKLIGTDVASLEEKYHGVTTESITDLDGTCLWMNAYGQTIFGNCMGRKLRDEIVNLNSQVTDLAKNYKIMHDSLADEMEFSMRLLNYNTEWNWRMRYERIDTLKGTPFAYRCHAKNSSVQEHVKAKPRTKHEVIEQTFADHGLILSDCVSKYVDVKEPVFCVNLIERVLWMNFSFQDVFNKSEKDLLEVFSPPYGFERFEKAGEFVLSKLPTHHEFRNIEFERIEGVNGRPMAYMVLFHTLDLGLEKSKQEQSEEILRKVGLSTHDLNEQCKLSGRGCILIGLGGCLLYMNDVFRKISEKDDSHLMSHWTHEVKEANPQIREILDTIFKVDLPAKYIFSVELKLGSVDARARRAKFEFIRIDNHDMPYAYYMWMDFVENVNNFRVSN